LINIFRNEQGAVKALVYIVEEKSTKEKLLSLF